ncbi:RteC domain-containing protein [Puia sp.]|uniref:RteC domain-containing protein n=1 Tax=Puia sp. TaxID=2045100 RepID=UPI002F3FAC03
MLPEYQEYYQQLLAAFHSHQATSRTEMEMIEVCFKSSLDHWGKVCRQVKAGGFGDIHEEIRFFREVKPSFASYIEYYTFRYHALLFAPVNDPLELARFWRWEQRKMQRFHEENREFCRYIQEGDTRHDAEYFRKTTDPCGSRHSAGLIHDLDIELVSPKDPLVTIMKAYELYSEYINQKLLNHLEA